MACAMHSIPGWLGACEAMKTGYIPTSALLEVKGLKTYFFTRDGVGRAVDGISFTVERAETLAIVGESGCRNSVTSLSILPLIASPPRRARHARQLLVRRALLDVAAPAAR